MEFADVVAEGMALDVEAYWGAGFLPGRFVSTAPSWDYAALARPLLERAGTALDMGTGEGGVLAALAPLPVLTVAYEEWWPTVPAAKATLRPLGVRLVVARGSRENAPVPGAIDPVERPTLPFADHVFDLVLNRHEAFDPRDLHRIVRPDGRFLTEQVGSDEADSVRSLLGLPALGAPWSAELAAEQLADAGWEIEDLHEEWPPMRFSDVAALIGYVRSLPWSYEDLVWSAATNRLRELHAQSGLGPLAVTSHRFVVEARPA